MSQTDQLEELSRRIEQLQEETRLAKEQGARDASVRVEVLIGEIQTAMLELDQLGKRFGVEASFFVAGGTVTLDSTGVEWYNSSSEC